MNDRRLILIFRTEPQSFFILYKRSTEYTLLVFFNIRDILGFLRGQQSWATELKK